MSGVLRRTYLPLLTMHRINAFQRNSVQLESIFITVRRLEYFKTSASVSSGFPNTRKQMKARDRRPSAFIVFDSCLSSFYIGLHVYSM